MINTFCAMSLSLLAKPYELVLLCARDESGDVVCQMFNAFVTHHTCVMLTILPLFIMFLTYKVYNNILESDIGSLAEYIPTEANEDYITRFKHQKYDDARKTWAYFKLKVRLLIRTALHPITINDASELIEEVIDRKVDMRSRFNDFREKFKTFPMNHAEAHTHPQSAILRSAMASFMADLAVKVGYKPYHVSCAKSDNYQGSRYFYNPKDLTIPYKNDKIEENTALIFTDVDYYADMPTWLTLMKPILIYTLVPTKMSNRTKEYSYHFEKNMLVYNVKGGATYKHKLWVYEGDTLSFEHNGDFYTYHVDQRTVPEDPDHRYICLIPAAKISYPHSILMTATGNLKRFRNKGYLYDPITDTVSIETASQYHSVELKGLVYNAIKERMANKTSPPIIADIERILQTSKTPEAGLIAPLLFNAMGMKLERNVVYTSSMVSNFHPIVEGAMTNEDGAPMGENASSNLVYPGAAYPTNSQASDIATVRGRVDKPRNNKTPPSYYKSHANDFLSQLIRKDRVGTPWQVHQVEKEQDKVAQKARTEAIKHTVCIDSTNTIKSFVKSEAYSTANDPRNISTMSHETTLMMSCFTYPFKEQILKTMPFYSPGMTPDQITERLKELTTKEGVLLTDYSRFDGSISEWLQQYIVRAAYNRWLTYDQSGEFDKWWAKVFTKKGVTKNGVHYDAGWGTRSGSPITTDGNTMINAFIMYVALRKSGLNIRQAFNSLGLYCGDDGYTMNRNNLKYCLEETVKELGLGVEVEVRKTGPYPYCGRLFLSPDITPDSFQDLKRTLPKLHLVSRGPETIEQRLTNKAAGYLVTDPKTPLLSDWAKKVIELTKLTPKHLTGEEQYKMNHPWPQTDSELLTEGVCNQLDFTSIELNQMINSIKSTTSLTDFPVLMENAEDAKIVAVRDDVLVYPSGHHNTIETIDTENAIKQTKQATKPRTRNLATQEANRTAPKSREIDERQRTNAVVQPLVRGRRCSGGKYHSSTKQQTQTLPPKARSSRSPNETTRQRNDTSSGAESSGSNKRRTTTHKRITS